MHPSPAAPAIIVSTIIATCNRPQLLLRTLGNLARQSMARQMEVIIVDDGSKTPVAGLLDSWQAIARPAFRLRHLRQPNSGPAVARNLGIRHSRGRFLHFLDDDDLMHPQALAHLAASLARRDGPAIAMASHQDWLDGATASAATMPATMAPQRILQAMIVGNWFVPVHGYLFSRPAMQRTGDWNPRLTSQEDDELLLRAALAGVTFHPVPEARVYYCQHQGVRRSLPEAPGTSLMQGLGKRLQAARTIRNLARRALHDKGRLPLFAPAFAGFEQRCQRIYAPLLAGRNRLRPASSLHPRS